jgi:hypothetical protein
MDIKKTEPTAVASSALWAKRIQERKQSGKSIRQYCTEQGLKEYHYYHWQRKLRLPPPASQGFVELKAQPVGGRIAVEVRGCRIEVERGFDPGTFQEILAALRIL